MRRKRVKALEGESIAQGNNCIDTGSSTYLVTEPLYPERQGPLERRERETKMKRDEKNTLHISECGWMTE